MLVCSIKEKKLSAILDKLKKIKKADLIELRFDALESLQIDEIKKLKKQISCPLIFTLRPKRQLGEYEKSEEERLEEIEKLLKLQPDFFDIENDIDIATLIRWKKAFPKTKFILSYHSLSYPKNLDNLFQKMLQKDVYGYKIAVLPSSFDEVSSFYDFTKKHTKKHKLSAITLGEKYLFFRLFRLANLFDYVAVDQPTAPGQLTYNEALSLYRLLDIDENTKFYALIGHPLDKSIGHIFHNQQFQKKGFSGVYVKISVLKDELASFMRFVKEAPFYGFSITSPLKEKAVQYADVKDQDLPSINTLVKKDDIWEGYNTDVLATKDLLNKLFLKDKKVAILGGGGAAKAIALALKKEKAKISFFVRDIKKIQPFAQENDFSYFSLTEKVKEKFDVLINTIPVTDGLVINEELIHPQMYVMDIVWPGNSQTALIAYAKEKKCDICDAIAFFYKQAEYQQKLFLNEGKNRIDINK